MQDAPNLKHAIRHVLDINHWVLAHLGVAPGAADAAGLATSLGSSSWTTSPPMILTMLSCGAGVCVGAVHTQSVGVHRGLGVESGLASVLDVGQSWMLS